MHRQHALAGLALLGGASAAITRFYIPCEIAPGSWFEMTLYNDGSGYLDDVMMWTSSADVRTKSLANSYMSTPNVTLPAQLSSKSLLGTDSMTGSFVSRYGANTEYSMLSAEFTVASSTSTKLCSSQHRIEARSVSQMSDEHGAAVQHDVPHSDDDYWPWDKPMQSKQHNDRRGGNTAPIANLVQSAERDLTTVGNAISRGSNLASAHAAMAGLASVVSQLQDQIATPADSYCSLHLAPIQTVEQAMTYVDITQRALNLITSGDSPTMLQNLCEAQASFQQLDGYIGGVGTFGSHKTKRAWPFDPPMMPPHAAKKAAASDSDSTNDTATVMAVIQPVVQAAESHLAVLITAITTNDTTAAQSAFDDFAYDQDAVWTLVDPKDAAACGTLSKENEFLSKTAALQVIGQMRAALNGLTSGDQQSRLSALCTIAGDFDKIDDYVNDGPFAWGHGQERRSSGDLIDDSSKPGTSSITNTGMSITSSSVVPRRWSNRGIPNPQLLNCPGGPVYAACYPPPSKRSGGSSSEIASTDEKLKGCLGDVRCRSALVARSTSSPYLTADELERLHTWVKKTYFWIEAIESDIGYNISQGLLAKFITLASSIQAVTDSAVPKGDSLHCNDTNETIDRRVSFQSSANIFAYVRSGLANITNAANAGDKQTVYANLCALRADAVSNGNDLWKRSSSDSYLSDENLARLNHAIDLAEYDLTHLSNSIVDGNHTAMTGEDLDWDFDCSGHDEDFGNLTQLEVLRNLEDAQVNLRQLALTVVTGNRTAVVESLCAIAMALNPDVADYLFPDAPERRSTSSRFGDQQIQKLETAIAAAERSLMDFSYAVIGGNQTVMETNFGTLNDSLKLVKRYASDDYNCTGDFGGSLTDLHGDLTKADVVDIIEQAQGRLSIVPHLIRDEHDIQAQIEFCQVYDIFLGPVQAYVFPAPGTYTVNGRRRTALHVVHNHTTPIGVNSSVDDGDNDAKLVRATEPYLSNAELASLNNIIQSTESHLSNLSAALQTQDEVAAQIHWAAFEQGLGQIQDWSMPGRIRGCDVQMNTIKDFSLAKALLMIGAAQISLRQISLAATDGDKQTVHQQVCTVESYRQIMQQIDGHLPKSKRDTLEQDLNRTVAAAVDDLKPMADAMSNQSAPDSDGKFATALRDYNASIEASKRLIGLNDSGCAELENRDVAEWIHNGLDWAVEGMEDVADHAKDGLHDLHGLMNDDEYAAKVKLCRANLAVKHVHGLDKRISLPKGTASLNKTITAAKQEAQFMFDLAETPMVTGASTTLTNVFDAFEKNINASWHTVRTAWHTNEACSNKMPDASDTAEDLWHRTVEYLDWTLTAFRLWEFDGAREGICGARFYGHWAHSRMMSGKTLAARDTQSYLSATLLTQLSRAIEAAKQGLSAMHEAIENDHNVAGGHNGANAAAFASGLRTFQSQFDKVEKLANPKNEHKHCRSSYDYDDVTGSVKTMLDDLDRILNNVEAGDRTVALDRLCAVRSIFDDQFGDVVKMYLPDIRGSSSSMVKRGLLEAREDCL